MGNSSSLDCGVGGGPKRPPGIAGGVGDLKLTYFNTAGRATPIRLALQFGNIVFDDVRISFNQMAEMNKAGLLPFNQLPILEVDGKIVPQSKAQLRYVGKLAGLYPTNMYEALEVDSVVDSADEVFSSVVPTFFIEDEEERLRARKQLMAKNGRLTMGFQLLENYLSDISTTQGYSVGPRLTVADLQVYQLCAWFGDGTVEFIPTNIFRRYPTITAVFKTVEDLIMLNAWKK